MSVAVLDLELDDALVARAAEGDQEAFGDLYVRYSQGLYDFAARTVHDRDLASDVVQTTFTRAWEAIQKGTQPNNVRAWLYTIARNDAIDQLRRLRRIVPDPRDDEGVSYLETRPDPGRDPEDLVYDQELANLVWTAAASLNPRQYSLLDLHLRQHLTPDELASSLGLRRDNVYMMLSRLRASLEESVSLLLLMRRGRRECRELDDLLAAHPAPELTKEMRRLVRKHLDTCQRCQEHSRRYISPAEIFAGLAAIPISSELRDAWWQQRIVPHLDPGNLAPLTPFAPAAPNLAPPPLAPVAPLPAPVPVLPPGIEAGLWWATPALAVKAGLIATSTIASVALVVTVATHQPDPVSLAAARDPDDVRSGSHQIGQPSPLNIIQVLWSPVAEMLGYSVLWSQQEQDLPDALSDLPGDAGEALSPPLAPGAWYFHMRTRGPGGEWTSTVHLGPFLIVAPPAAGPPPTSTAPPPQPDPMATAVMAGEEEGGEEVAADDDDVVVVALHDGFTPDDAEVGDVAIGSPLLPITTPTTSPTPTLTLTPGVEIEQAAPLVTLTLTTGVPTRTLTRTLSPTPRSTPAPSGPTSAPVATAAEAPSALPTAAATPAPPATTEPGPTTGPLNTPIPQPRSIGAAPTETPVRTVGATAGPTARAGEPTKAVSPTRTRAPATGVAVSPTPSVTPAVPTRTPCGALSLSTLDARVQAERVVVTWLVTGVCGPYTGTITASQQGAAPYQTYPISALTGTINDTPPRCAGLVTYRLSLTDGSGQTVTGNATRLVDRDC